MMVLLTSLDHGPRAWETWCLDCQQSGSGAGPAVCDDCRDRNAVCGCDDCLVLGVLDALWNLHEAQPHGGWDTLVGDAVVFGSDTVGYAVAHMMRGEWS